MKIKILSTSVVIIMLASVMQAQAAFNFDLENLRNQDSFLTKAYDVIKIQNAWEFIRNNIANLLPVSIGIVDTGIDANHQEFNNPKVDFGSSPTTALMDSSAPKGHGTQVIGIIGANNVLGSGGALSVDSLQMNGIVSGALEETQYKLEVENFNVATTTQSSGVFAALENALRRNPSVVNMSFGAPKCSATSLAKECYKTDADFIDAFGAYTKVFNALENQDVLFVAAAGNWDIDTRLNVLPATIRLPNLITIGATDLDDKRATFFPLTDLKSNFGSDVDISAPGVSVYAPKPGNTYDIPRRILGVPVPGLGFSGTSASAPMVTGVAGILKAIKPMLTPLDIKRILIRTADPVRTGEPTKRLGTGCYLNPNSPVFTGCRLNALRAVQAAFGIRYIDDFEALSLGPLKNQGGWFFSPATAPNFVVQDAVVSEGNKAVKGQCTAPCPTDQVIGKSIPGPASAAVPIEPITNTTAFTTISFDMRVESGLGQVLATDAFFRNVFIVFQNPDGGIFLVDGIGSSTLLRAGAELGTWYHLDVHVDLENQRVRARIDDGPWSAFVPFLAPITSIDHVHLRVGSGLTPTLVDTVAYYDSIYVTVQEP